MSDPTALATRIATYSSQVPSLETSLHTNQPSSPLGFALVYPDVGVTFRHSGWQPRRDCVRRALTTMERAGMRAARFEACGSNAWVLQSDDDPPELRLSCDKCRDRFCQPCSQQRSRHIGDCVARFAVGADLRFFTFTLRMTDATIAQDVDRLYDCFVRLRRRVLWSRSQKGGVFFIEIKRRRFQNGWHTHLHVLSEGLWVCIHKLKAAWHEITGDSFIVDIEECLSTQRAAYYCAKYSGKGVHGSCYHDPAVLLEAMLAIKGRRLVGKFGTWRALDLSETVPEGTWHRISSLCDLLRRADTGDPSSVRILDYLKGVAPCPAQMEETPARGP